jgi:mevalonate kinase
MPAFSAYAPGKVILFGEHAVVYGRPAIAAPVTQVRAKAMVSMDPKSRTGLVKLQAPDIGLETTLDDLPENHPLAAVVLKAAAALQIRRIPACSIKVISTIPIAGGMGSGAAVSVAILRAFSAALGHLLSDEQISQLVYEVELIHHGTPSGIDNTVITYAKPVYFMKGEPIQTLRVKQPFTLVIGVTSVQSPTAEVVSDVRHAWETDKMLFDGLFDSAGGIASRARSCIEDGHVEALGSLMDDNQVLLRQMGVSSPELEALIEAAHSAGALGAKLSGAGRGGNMIALVAAETSDRVVTALKQAGAVRTIITEIGKP